MLLKAPAFPFLFADGMVPLFQELKCGSGVGSTEPRGQDGAEITMQARITRIVSAPRILPGRPNVPIEHSDRAVRVRELTRRRILT